MWDGLPFGKSAYESAIKKRPNQADSNVSFVVWAGIEPVTQGFSELIPILSVFQFIDYEDIVI